MAFHYHQCHLSFVKNLSCYKIMLVIIISRQCILEQFRGQKEFLVHSSNV